MAKYSQEDLRNLDIFFDTAIWVKTPERLVSLFWSEGPHPANLIEYGQARRQFENQIQRCQPKAWELDGEIEERLRVIPLAPYDDFSLLVKWARVCALLLAENEYTAGVGLLISLMGTACQYRDTNLMLAGTQLLFIICAVALRQGGSAEIVNGVVLTCMKMAVNSNYSDSFDNKSKALARELFLLLITLTGLEVNTPGGKFSINKGAKEFAKSIDQMTSKSFNMSRWVKEYMKDFKSA